jgi:Trk-type K+ transport system membrane component
MTWAATVKESTNRTIFTELPAIFKRFRFCFIVCTMCLAMIIVFAFLPLMEWQIIDWVYVLSFAWRSCLFRDSQLVSATAPSFRSRWSSEVTSSIRSY